LGITAVLAAAFAQMNITSALAALIDDAATARFAVAVSGGADSMALVAMMAEAFPHRIVALTVDHALRTESAAEAQQVAQWCAAIEVPHHILRWETPATKGNIQAQARSARYELMRCWCDENEMGYVLSAHNREDVAETLLMRLARGAGVRGLAAMQAKRALSPNLILLRPLLKTSHAELVGYLETRQQPWIEDPSNQNTAFDRVKVRQWLAQPPQAHFSAERLAMSAQALAHADAALDWASARCFADMATVTDGRVMFRSRSELLALPSELIRRQLLRVMTVLRGPALPPRQEDLERLYAMLGDPLWRGSTLGKCRFAPAEEGFEVKSEA
jgi:tRNA(Ile)-lysidine synthase